MVVAFFLCFILGSSYGSESFGETFPMMKYRELLFIPVLIQFITVQSYRVWSWKAFVIVSAVTLLMSCLINIGILDVNNQGDPCLKGRITHSIFIFLNFLMIGVQLDLLGLLIYIGFLASQFFYAKKLPDKEKWFCPTSSQY